MNKRLVILASCAALSACASYSGIVPMGQDTFFLSKQGASSFSGLASLKAEVMQDAGSYCAKDGKAIHILSTNESKPPFILGNYPRVEIQFSCQLATASAAAQPAQ